MILTLSKIKKRSFFNIYLAVPSPSGHSRGDSLNYPVLITAFVQFRLEGHRKPSNEVESLSLVECLVGFELGTFQFQLQHFNPIGLDYEQIFWERQKVQLWTHSDLLCFGFWEGLFTYNQNRCFWVIRVLIFQIWKCWNYKT